MKKDKQKSARQIKEEKVQVLTEKLAKAKTIIFTNYHGLAANQLTQLRIKIKGQDGEFLVEKNSLIKLALKKNNLEIPESLTGPSSVTLAFSDEITPLKELTQTNKELGFPILKFGFFNKEFIDSDSLLKLSQIPPRQTLEAKLVGSLNSPIFGFVNVLSTNIKNLASVLNQIALKQRG